MFSKRLLPFSATSTTVLIKVSRNTLTKSHTTTRSASPAASPAASPLLRVQSNSMQLKRLFHIPSTKTAALFFATLASTSTPNTINSKTQSNGAMAFSTCSSSSPSSSVIRSGFVPKIADPDPDRVATIREYGAELSPLDPLGAEIRGLDLKKIASTPPPQKVIDALQGEMAERGFLVFKNNPDMTVDEQVAFSCWWGAHRMHSTHGVHPATPDRNRHIFRLSNDRNHGILGVGPQWYVVRRHFFFGFTSDEWIRFAYLFFRRSGIHSNCYVRFSFPYFFVYFTFKITEILTGITTEASNPMCFRMHCTTAFVSQKMVVEHTFAVSYFSFLFFKSAKNL